MIEWRGTEPRKLHLKQIPRTGFGLHFETEALLTPWIYTRQCQIVHVVMERRWLLSAKEDRFPFSAPPTPPSLAFLLVITHSAFPFSHCFLPLCLHFPLRIMEKEKDSRRKHLPCLDLTRARLSFVGVLLKFKTFP